MLNLVNMDDVLLHVRTEFAAAIELQEKSKFLEAYIQYLKCMGHVLQYLRLDTQSWVPRFSSDDCSVLFTIARSCLEMSEKIAKDHNIFKQQRSSSDAIDASADGLSSLMRVKTVRHANEGMRPVSHVFASENDILGAELPSPNPESEPSPTSAGSQSSRTATLSASVPASLSQTPVSPMISFGLDSLFRAGSTAGQSESQMQSAMQLGLLRKCMENYSLARCKQEVDTIH